MVLKAMDEFASAVVEERIRERIKERMPDDEEIEITAGILYANWSHRDYAICGFKDAIKWLRSKLEGKQ